MLSIIIIIGLIVTICYKCDCQVIWISCMLLQFHRIYLISCSCVHGLLLCLLMVMTHIWCFSLRPCNCQYWFGLTGHIKEQKSTRKFTLFMQYLCHWYIGIIKYGCLRVYKQNTKWFWRTTHKHNIYPTHRLRSIKWLSRQDLYIVNLFLLFLSQGFANVVWNLGHFCQ